MVGKRFVKFKKFFSDCSVKSRQNSKSSNTELDLGRQKSEYLEKSGFVDLIVERKDLVSKIGTLLSILLKENSAINSEQNETSEDSQSLTRAAS